MIRNFFKVILVLLTLLFTACFGEDIFGGNDSKVEKLEKSSDVVLVLAGTTSAENGNITVENDFYIGKYEVTQYEWETVMTGNTNNISAIPSYFVGTELGNNPVEMVSWYDVIVFCNRLSMKEELTEVYSISESTDPDDWGTVPTRSNAIWNAVTTNSTANGYRIPTSKEWEYVARGGSEGLGKVYAGSDVIGDVAWYDMNSYDLGSSHKDYGTHLVGEKLPNDLGIYDMSGNVFEWCSDLHPLYIFLRGIRGGSWYGDAYNCETDRVYFINLDSRDYYIGFRYVRRKEA